MTSTKFPWLILWTFLLSLVLFGAGLALAQVDLGALKTELATDPKALGLPAFFEKDAGTPAKLLNTVGVGVAFQVNREPVTPVVVLKQIDKDEWKTIGSLNVTMLSAVFAAAPLDLSDPTTLSLLQSCFPVLATKTIANMAALAKRQGSRAEVLFGTGVIISAQNVADAWRSK